MGKIRTVTSIAIAVTLGMVGVGCSKNTPATTQDTTPTTKTVTYDDGTTITTTTYPNANPNMAPNTKSVSVFPDGETITSQTIQGTGTTTETTWAQGSACSGCSSSSFIGSGVGGGIPTVGVVLLDRADNDTKDVDLQRAELQDQETDNKAQSIAAQFGMSFESARQLAQLSDKIQALGEAGSVSDEDREAVANSALSVAGISPDDVNQAVAQMIKDGDQKALNGLIDQAAINLGMPSSVGLRDQLLPSLGIRLGS